MISFIVPTIGRPSLAATLRSIETYPGDEIIVAGNIRRPFADPRARGIPCASGGNWGCLERTIAIHEARGQYLAFMDDDDTYTPGARAVMAEAIARHPDRPTLFRMRYPNGFVLWTAPALVVANVSSQMMLIPNVPAKLGTWTGRREGDFDFLASMAWRPSEIIWQTEIIAELGHNEGYAA